MRAAAGDVGMVTKAWAALVGVVALVGCGASRPHFAHPATTTATVTGAFVNGIGGDPAVDYRFAVAGHPYSGYAVAGTDYHGELRKGDRITVTYEVGDPAKSCLC